MTYIFVYWWRDYIDWHVIVEVVLVLPVGGMGHLDLLCAFHFLGFGVWWLMGLMYIIKLDDIIFGDNMGRNVGNFWDFSWHCFIDWGHPALQGINHTRDSPSIYIPKSPESQYPLTPSYKARSFYKCIIIRPIIINKQKQAPINNK